MICDTMRQSGRSSWVWEIYTVGLPFTVHVLSNISCRRSENRRPTILIQAKSPMGISGQNKFCPTNVEKHAY